jgi:hypothetical protein
MSASENQVAAAVAADIKEASRFSSRKFVLAVLVILIGTGLTLGEKFSSSDLLELLKWTVGMYMGFNVTEKATERAKELWISRGKS